ncbi:MAG: dTMP kinase [Actinobacteria bacterium]|nr:dTMP kinase [Actinomycetota bacterium]
MKRVGSSVSFLVSIEGFDGVGKTTQAKLLHNNLTKLSIKSLIVREPGGTTLAEKIREELNQNSSLTNTTELLLFEVARSDLVENVIMPNLSDGIIVVTDRYIDSTLAYQGFGRGLNLSKVKQLNNISSLGLLPEITFLLDMNVEDALRRATNRNEDPEEKQITKFEKETVEFHQRVRNGFLEIAKNNKERIIILDSTLGVEELSKIIIEKVIEKIEN